MTSKATVSVQVGGAPTSGMSVQLSFADGSFSGTFTQANAKRLDDFTAYDGSFTSQTFVATEPGPNKAFRVMFRFDPAINRHEWSFEMSDATNINKVTPVMLGAYTATLMNAGAVVTTINVPLHTWGGRWRWFDKQRPDLAGVTPASLQARKILPWYDLTGLVPHPSPMPGHTYTPMTTAGMTEGMGTTGERPEIGPFMRGVADMVVLGKSRATVQAWCEGLNTFPICHRDLTTGAPIDLVAYPKASSYSIQGQNTPWIQIPQMKMPSGATIAYDTGHSPNMVLVEYLQTGDPYLLELMCFQANQDLLEWPYSGRFSQSGRYWAWGCRNWFALKLAMAQFPAAAKLPSWLYARTIPATMVGNYLAQMNAWMADTTDPRAQTFHAPGASLGSKTTDSNGTHYVAGAYIDYWQREMQSWVTGWLVENGEAAWQAVHKFLLQGTISCTNGLGWLRSHPAPYSLDAKRNAQLAAALAATDMSMQVTTPGQFSGPTQVTIDSEVIQVTASATATTWPITARGAKPVPHAINAAVLGPWFASFAEQVAGNMAIHAPAYPWMAGDPDGQHILYFMGAGDSTYPTYSLSALRQAYANPTIAPSDLDPSVAFLLGGLQGPIAKNAALQVDLKWCVGRRP